MAESTDELSLLIRQLQMELGETPDEELIDTSAAAKKARRSAEAQLSVWIPKPLQHRLKQRGIETEQSLKEMTIKALEAYLRVGER